VRTDFKPLPETAASQAPEIQKVIG